MTTGVARMDFTWGPVVKDSGVIGLGMVILAALARAIGWLLNWNGRREERHGAELRAREAAVTAREVAYTEKVELRISGLERGAEKFDAVIGRMRSTLIGMRGSLVEVTVELRVHAPESAALQRAERRLRETYQYDEPLMADEGLDALARQVGGGS